MNTDDIKDRQYFFYFVFCFFLYFFLLLFFHIPLFLQLVSFFIELVLIIQKKRYKSLHNLLIINTHPLLACIF